MNRFILMIFVLVLAGCNQHQNRAIPKTLVEDTPFIKAVSSQGYSRIIIGRVEECPTSTTLGISSKGRRFIGSLAGKRIIGRVCLSYKNGKVDSSKVERITTM